jgi:CRP-like cAMP-binding protein
MVNSTAVPPIRSNYLISQLPSDIQDKLSRHCDIVTLLPGMSLHEAGDEISYAYYPVEGIVSIQYLMEDGATSEVAVVGSEGMIGISLFLCRHKMLCHALVQSAGYAYRIPVQVLRDVLSCSIQFNHLLLRYTMVLMIKLSITASCNRHHTITQQLSRRLLMALDRLANNHILITQDSLAHALGVRREGITDAARKLQAQGIIKYHRGDITILDRAKLEKQCCECYAAMKKEGELLLPYNLPCKFVQGRPALMTGK